MLPQDGCGAGFGDGTFERGADGFGFADSGNHNEEVRHLHEARDGNAESGERHGFEIGEGLVVNLLLAAGFGELNDAHRGRVVESGSGRIVEGEVAILTDAKERNGWFREP